MPSKLGSGDSVVKALDTDQKNMVLYPIIIKLSLSRAWPLGLMYHG